MEAIIFSGSHSLQRKPFVLLEAIRIKGKRSFKSKLFLLVEPIIFSGIHWPVVEIIPLSGNCSF